MSPLPLPKSEKEPLPFGNGPFICFTDPGFGLSGSPYQFNHNIINIEVICNIRALPVESQRRQLRYFIFTDLCCPGRTAHIEFALNNDPVMAACIDFFNTRPQITDICGESQNICRRLNREGVLDLLADICVLAFGVVMLVVGFKYAVAIGAKGFFVSIPKLSRFWMYFPVPVAGFAMIIFELESIYNHTKSFFVADKEESK